MNVPSLVEVDNEDQVIPEHSNTVWGWHGDDEGKHIINERVECLLGKGNESMVIIV